MTIVLLDLAGADPSLRFSPYCWRTRLALAHQDLPVETVAWRFTDADRIAFSGQGKVPVIQDGARCVSDSWDIAEYLESTYPDRPSLFGGATGMAHARFVNAWADTVMNPAIARMVVRDVWSAVDARDRAYFRTSREARFGMPLEQVVADRDDHVVAFRRLLQPVRAVLRVQPWLGGVAPSYADYIVFGGLQWARCISRFELLDEQDEVAAWRGRVLGLFDGLARNARTV